MSIRLSGNWQNLFFSANVWSWIRCNGQVTRTFDAEQNLNCCWILSRVGSWMWTGHKCYDDVGTCGVWRTDYLRHVTSDAERTHNVDYIDDHNDTTTDGVTSTSTSNELLNYFRSKYALHDTARCCLCWFTTMLPSGIVGYKKICRALRSCYFLTLQFFDISPIDSYKFLTEKITMLIISILPLNVFKMEVFKSKFCIVAKIFRRPKI